MRSNTFAVSTALLAAVALAGCADAMIANAEGRLQPQLPRETAVALGRNVAPEQITVSAVEGVRECNSAQCVLRWKATAPTGDFDCSAVPDRRDNLTLRKAVCVKK